MPLGVLLVDDHTMLRDGIRNILERTADFCVVGEVANGLDAVSLCKKLRPQLVVMEIHLSEMNGIEATTEIMRYCPGTSVVILSTYDDENSVIAAFRSGVRGFLAKQASAAELIDALRTVSKGGSYLSSQVSDHLLKRLQRGDLEPSELPWQHLSPRERQVLRLVAEGKTTKEIANMLGLGLQTIRTYRKTLMKKIGVTNVAGLTTVAFAAGLTNWGKLDPKATTRER